MFYPSLAGTLIKGTRNVEKKNGKHYTRHIISFEKKEHFQTKQKKRKKLSIFSALQPAKVSEIRLEIFFFSMKRRTTVFADKYTAKHIARSTVIT